MPKKKDIKYVQLEPAAFLSDTDYQIMTAEQRGIYCSIIFYLYANGGQLKLNGDTDLLQQKGNSVIAMLSNCHKTGKEFELLWNTIEKKFIVKNGTLSHKRVTEEIKRAYNYRRKKSLAGKKGMQHRYNKDPNTVSNGDITKESKVKESKDNSFNSPINKTKLFPIKGKACCKKGCKLPAIYTDTSGSYDHHYCGTHMPDEVKKYYTW